MSVELSVKKSSKLLKYIEATVTASSEEDVEELLKLTNPTDDREEMGEIYENTLGYNPITYFDRAIAISMLSICADDAPKDAAEYIHTNEEKIIDKVMAEYEKENNREMILAGSVCLVLKELTGWAPDEIDGISVNSFGPDDPDSFEDYDSEESIDDNEEDSDEDDESSSHRAKYGDEEDDEI